MASSGPGFFPKPKYNMAETHETDTKILAHRCFTVNCFTAERVNLLTRKQISSEPLPPKVSTKRKILNKHNIQQRLETSEAENIPQILKSSAIGFKVLTLQKVYSQLRAPAGPAEGGGECPLRDTALLTFTMASFV